MAENRRTYLPVFSPKQRILHLPGRIRLVDDVRGEDASMLRPERRGSEGKRSIDARCLWTVASFMVMNDDGIRAARSFAIISSLRPSW